MVEIRRHVLFLKTVQFLGRNITMTADSLVVEIPPYVRPELVVDWDIYTEEKLLNDLHIGYHSLHASAPDIFYTPRNGGHWVITRHDLQTQILKDAEHFSSRELHIPKANSPYVMIPLSLDPPEHTPYRAVLMKHFGIGSVRDMEGKLVEWANRLIDRVIAKGECDFTEELGAGFPVSVFMELMGMPLDRFEEFRAIVQEYFTRVSPERRIELQSIIVGIITELFEDRRREPRNDLASKLLQEEVRGRKLTTEELQSMGFLLFLGGLDTVANALTFSIRHLAGDPALQERLEAEPARIPDFVEESLRRYAVVNQTRIVKKDVEIAGAHFHEGDMLICPLTLAGMDERKNPHPERFDIDRKDRAHITFSVGAHTCIGNVLARAEMRVFVDAWLKRVKRFHVAAGTKPAWRPGLVMALESLPLEWEPATCERVPEQVA
ncbi:cytochrome P450 [Xanthobacter flavus]|uniref:cytochrome P450 n=1 Tax=Xanthobacter flavus TaxID=281 RepID=UPI003727A8CD